GTGNHERLSVDIADNRVHASNGEDRGKRNEPLADLDLNFRGDAEAAIRIGARGQGLGFERAQVCVLAGTHVNFKCGLMLGRASVYMAVAERRSRILERDLVKAPPVCIDCSVNTSELLLQESVGAAP